MQDPRTPEEYLGLLDDVLFELGEMLACAEEEGDAEGEFKVLAPVYETIARELRAVQSAIGEGRSGLGGGREFGFMPLVKQWKTLIPFAAELEVLNLVYKRGLEE
jgi:hypothetical protein